jgi:hypothetical protein
MRLPFPLHGDMRESAMAASSSLPVFGPQTGILSINIYFNELKEPAHVGRPRPEEQSARTHHPPGAKRPRGADPPRYCAIHVLPHSINTLLRHLGFIAFHSFPLPVHSFYNINGLTHYRDAATVRRRSAAFHDSWISTLLQ